MRGEIPALSILLALSCVAAVRPGMGEDLARFPARASDYPNDAGTALWIEWEPPVLSSGAPIDGFALYRAEGTEAPDTTIERRIALFARTATSFRDAGLRRGRAYAYRVAALSGESIVALSPPTPAASPTVQYFHAAKGFLLINLLVVSTGILVSVHLARRGRQFTIRKIAGLEAVEEAVGRATEMGKPVLFVPGTQDLDNVQTIAGITILGAIAQMTAHYETAIDIPVSRSLVLSTGRETVKEAYTAAGRPDLFHEEIVHYVTDEQFGYVAAIDGYMLRERPATCFYMGAFFAESLILAETGNSIGAIQIAGTAQATQLPFFVAACDYTLIGEELFAASAYLSKSPSLLGSLRGQDIGKALAMLFILAGVAAETIGRLGPWGSPLLALSEFLKRFFATSF